MLQKLCVQAQKDRFFENGFSLNPAGKPPAICSMPGEIQCLKTQNAGGVKQHNFTLLNNG